MPPETFLLLFVCLLFLQSLWRCRRRGSQCGRKRGYPSKSIHSSLACDFPSSLPSYAKNRCFSTKMRYPTLLTRRIDMFRISFVRFSRETIAMPSVSAAEKSMTAQPSSYLTSPMRGKLATHVLCHPLCAQV